MKRVVSLTFAMTMLLCGAVKAGDVEDCRNPEALLKGDSAWVVSACRHLADQGDAHAQFALGIVYNRGYGVQRNYAEAMRWFRRAADQGDAGAQYNLAFLYETGRGVRKDLVRAYMWFDLAGRSAETPAHQGYAIQYRDSVASKMTPDQIAKAKKLAADWKPEPSR